MKFVIKLINLTKGVGACQILFGIQCKLAIMSEVLHGHTT
jgi:hypothetical protein